MFRKKFIDRLRDKYKTGGLSPIPMKSVSKLPTYSKTSGLDTSTPKGYSRDLDYTAREGMKDWQIQNGYASQFDTFNVPSGSVFTHQEGGVKYNTMDKVQDALTVGGLTPGVGIIPDAVNTGISAVRAGYNYLTGDTERAKSQVGDLALNAASMIPAAGTGVGALKLASRGNKIRKAGKALLNTKAGYGVLNNNAPEKIIHAENLGGGETPSFVPSFGQKAKKGGEREPYLSVGSKDINTDAGSRVGFGGKISVPLLESIRRGESSAGLRGEIDAVVRNGNNNLRDQIEANTAAGTLPDDMATSPKVWNTAAGLRGYYNRSLGRRSGLSLNMNAGAGLGSGEHHGAYIKETDDASEGNTEYNYGSENEGSKVYGDVSASLMKNGRHRETGVDVSGGVQASYGSKNSPNPGARLGLKGSYGPISGNVGYDFTNKTPRAGVSLNFQEGGMYERMQQYKTGGQQLPGGEMQPIPGSDAVEFNGQSHDEGGIMLDPQTEVEGGETMDQVTMAKNGGKRKDYFFSQHLKEGGVSYADMHKEILAEGGDQAKIDWLAKMQEKAAGRSPGKIQTASNGGIKRFQAGGEGGVEDGKPIYNEFSNNEFINLNPTLAPLPVQYQQPDLPDLVVPAPDLTTDEDKTLDELQKLYPYVKRDQLINWNKKKTKPKTKTEKKVEEKKNTPSKNTQGTEEDLNPILRNRIMATIPRISVDADTYNLTSQDKDGDGIPDYLDDTDNIQDAIKKEEEKIKNSDASTEEKQSLLDQLKAKARRGDVPLGAYAAGAAQLLPAAYSFFHKQPDAEQGSYNSGFTSPIVAERGKGAKLERVNYNVERATNASDMRGINRFIETSGGGPANIINKMAAYSKKQKGDAAINAAETRANIQIANQEAQLGQQMELSNMQRAQQASMTNAQMIRAEAARKDQINMSNANARQKIKDDEEYQKYAGISATAQGIAGMIGDSMSYKANERMARAIGSEGIYDRDKLRDVVTKYASKNGIPDGKGGWICTAGNCNETDINTFITSDNKTKD